MDSEIMVFKNNLRKYRLHRNYSQKKLADLINVNRKTIGSIEAGEYSPNAKMASLLCLILGVKFEELFYWEYEKLSKPIDMAEEEERER